MMYGKPEISARTKRMANDFKKEINSGRFKKKVHTSLDAIIKLAAYKLKRVGKVKESKLLLKEWSEQSLRIGIGSHDPLSKWLSDQYLKWEFLLSKDVVHALRLDDIHTINHAIPVVFSCIDDIDEIEYFMHLCHDDLNKFRGLLPVTAYWTSFWSCVGFSWSTGFVWCAPISMGVEIISDSVVCPSVNGSLYKLACNK